MLLSIGGKDYESFRSSMSNTLYIVVEYAESKPVRAVAVHAKGEDDAVMRVDAMKG